MEPVSSTNQYQPLSGQIEGAPFRPIEDILKNARDLVSRAEKARETFQGVQKSFQYYSGFVSHQIHDKVQGDFRISLATESARASLKKLDDIKIENKTVLREAKDLAREFSHYDSIHCLSHNYSNLAKDPKTAADGFKKLINDTYVAFEFMKDLPSLRSNFAREINAQSCCCIIL